MAYFKLKDLDMIRPVAGQQYKVNAKEIAHFHRLLDQLEILAYGVAKFAGVNAMKVRRERVDRQAGRGATYKNFTDYVLIGVAPEEINVGRTLFVKFVIHLLNEPDAVFSIQLDTAHSGKDKAPDSVTNYVRKIRTDFSIRMSEVLKLDELEFETLLVDPLKTSLSEYRQAYNYMKSQEEPVEAPVDPPPPEPQEQSYEKTAGPTIRSENEKVFLNTENLAQAYANIIVRSTNNNKVKVNVTAQEDRFYGIFGQWGRGKTFFWNQVRAYMEHDQEHAGKYEFVEFHAWKYQDTPAIWAYMYESFADRYFEKGSTFLRWLRASWDNAWKAYRLSYYRDRSKFFGFWRSLILLLLANIFGAIYWCNWQVLVPGVVVLTGLTYWKKFSKPLISKASRHIRQHTKRSSYLKHLGIQHEIQRELSALLNAWTAKADRTIVLFIDDIDRCSHDKIIEIVDALRVMLNHPEIQKRLIVIAAIDERILHAAIRAKYKNFIDEEIRVDVKGTRFSVETISNEYIDKLFVAGIRLDPLSDEQISEIMRGMSEPLISPSAVAGKGQGVTIPSGIPGGGEGNEPDDDSKPEGDEVIYKNLQGELTTEEAGYLNECAQKLINPTPRLLRGYSAKYRLCKIIVELLVDKRNDRKLSNTWYHDFDPKKALMEAIVLEMNGIDYRTTFEEKKIQKLAPYMTQGVEMVCYYQR